MTLEGTQMIVNRPVNRSLTAVCTRRNAFQTVVKCTRLCRNPRGTRRVNFTRSKSKNLVQDRSENCTYHSTRFVALLFTKARHAVNAVFLSLSLSLTQPLALDLVATSNSHTAMSRRDSSVDRQALFSRVRATIPGSLFQRVRSSAAYYSQVSLSLSLNEL